VPAAATGFQSTSTPIIPPTTTTSTTSTAAVVQAHQTQCLGLVTGGAALIPTRASPQLSLRLTIPTTSIYHTVYINRVL